MEAGDTFLTKTLKIFNEAINTESQIIMQIRRMRAFNNG